MAVSTISGGSVETEDRIRRDEKSKISRQLTIGSLVCLLSWILLIIAFSSPYWLSSYKYTYSSFVRLGLWDFCFRDFRHPYFQYDDKFDGCHWIYSSKYHNIRDWLQPPWFIFVQAMMVIALIFSLLTLIVIAFVLMLFFIRYQFIAIGIAFILEVLAGTQREKSVTGAVRVMNVFLKHIAFRK
ncbi:hypothetical protein B4U80_02775 [Leptotrombidium deliense]|uniref:Uncharacterized protein n=1 Tax=Leptotrombidium deliense TaxID=299467 RepID=A0A443SDF6_9ACAR|nr:hypothetical protein B4U80_02775 [Leptotrombidium deliense]